MKSKMSVKAMLVLHLFSVVFLSMAYAEKTEYIGVDKCKGCHKGSENWNVFEIWEKSLHARAFETLKAKGEEKNPKCLPCHTTGYGEGGYKPGTPNASTFEGVQCESCHGPGSLYKRSNHMKDVFNAVGKGLIIPMESLCIKCHNSDSPHFKGFDYESAVKKIEHLYGKSS